MPPSRHSGSSRSAHKDSDQMPSDQNYTLGDYSFRIERSSVPGSTNDSVTAICTKGGKNARKSIQIASSAKLNSWYVEANETEATVYILQEKPTIDIGDFDYATGISGCSVSYLNTQFQETITDNYIINGAVSAACFMGGGTLTIVFASRGPFSSERTTVYHGVTYKETYTGIASSFDGETYYYASHSVPCSGSASSGVPINGIPSGYSVQKAAIKMLFGGEDEYETTMVGRFAIDLEDAGGDGPGSDWSDPGDYDPDWEEGDPTHTLYVTVTGALSGRHNDPIEDPSYSYIPADKYTVKDYGCGGDGGHGGGGGAGASTVVVHKFATNQANSKEVTAIARRHGYGSGGGKGGKGGDGCILVYY